MVRGRTKVETNVKNPLCSDVDTCMRSLCKPPYACINLDYNGVIPSMEKLTKLEKLLSKSPTAISKIIEGDVAKWLR